jgi:sugar phosphate isomerase/epimerase
LKARWALRLVAASKKRSSMVRLDQIGLQCYTIRDYCKTEEDFAESMAKAAKIGYRAVQISAVGPIAPERIKSICDSNGLIIAITHEPGPEILGNPQKVIKRLQAMGCENTAFSGSGKDAAEYAKMAADIARVAPVYQAAGIQLSCKFWPPPAVLGAPFQCSHLSHLQVNCRFLAANLTRYLFCCRPQPRA